MAGVSITAWAFGTFASKTEVIDVIQRLDRIENKADQRFDRIENKVDKILEKRSY